MMSPVTRYAKSGEVHIAYQVVGDAPVDLVFTPGFVSHVEHIWNDPGGSRLLTRLASFSRVIQLDKRGTGLSDRTSEIFTLEQRMDDIRAVMDAVGSERAAVFGPSEGGSMSILFAATYPERTSALIIYGGYARRSWASDYTFGLTESQWDSFLARLEREWGGPVGIEILAPSVANDARFRDWWTTYLKLGGSPGAALAVMRMNREIDIRHVLPSVRVPTLILHRVGDKNIKVEHGRYLAEKIPGAKLIELPGTDHIPWVGDADAIVDEIEEFLTGVRHVPEPDRVLATVLFMDIVGSTERAIQFGDRRWRELLESFYNAVRRELARFRGREIDTAGDGVLATFDGPARGVRCACATLEAVRSLGLEARAGLHTGEIELIGDKIGGIAVHIGARVAAHAAPGQVWTTSTVKDLVAGSGLCFSDCGLHALKGVPGEWHLFAAER
jgi:pimeloyl-ACP methyl ester carboxylesterase